MSGKNVRSNAFCDSSPNFQDKIDEERIYASASYVALQGIPCKHYVFICFLDCDSWWSLDSPDPELGRLWCKSLPRKLIYCENDPEAVEPWIRPDSGKHNSTVCWGDESGWISSVYKSILCSIYIHSPHLPHVPAVPAVPPTDSAEVVGRRSCKKPKPATRSHNNVGIFHNIPYTSWMQQLATARRNNNSWSSLVWWVCTLVTLKRPWDVWDLWSTVSTQSTRLTFNSLWSPWEVQGHTRKLTKVCVKCWKALSKAAMGSNRP